MEERSEGSNELYFGVQFYIRLIHCICFPISNILVCTVATLDCELTVRCVPYGMGGGQICLYITEHYFTWHETDPEGHCVVD